MENFKNGEDKEEPKVSGDASICGSDSLHRLLKENLKPHHFQEVNRLLTGLNCGRALETIALPESATALSVEHGFDLQAFSFHAEKELLREPRVVRVGLIQNSIALPTTAHFVDQKMAIFKKLKPIIDTAGSSGVNILCLQEAWMMPFAFCTREKRWCEFAEPVDGESTEFLQRFALKYNMVIISPILERDVNHGEVIWNTAVVIGNHGKVIGKHRKNHIPRVGDFNESTYYMEGNTGHPVFETAFGKIAINICYGRHHPLNWLAFGLNGAEIVFNPSATVGERALQGKDQEKELELDSDEAETEIEVPLPLTVTSRALYMLGDFTAGPAFRFTQWLQFVRKRTAKNRSSGFPHRLSTTMPSTSSIRESIENPKFEVHPDPTEISLWERLGKAAMLDIESSSFSWDNLSSLHHTEHSSSNEHSEDEMNKALEVTVNSGGVVFFAFFNCHGIADAFPKEAAAVIKISSSRMATQSERLGYEFAKWMGIQTPQARVIHYTSLEWQQIKEAAEKAREAANSEGDEIGEVTCFELLEALELSRCLFFMSYVHGSPLLENSSAFESRESKERTSEALGRVLMLDLVIRNEDRLPCRELRWRGNSANLLLAEKLISANADALEAAFDSAINRYRPKVIRALQKERRSTSVDCRLHSRDPGLMSQASDLSEISESPRSTDMSLKSQTSGESMSSDLNIVAIDSGVPRRPPAGKRADDQVNYPKLVELLINSSGYASNLLYDITGGKLGYPPPEDMDTTDVHASDKRAVVHAFRTGFRAALRDLQGFHIFLLTLHQRLDTLLRLFMNIINKISSGESDKEDSLVPDSPSLAGCGSCSSPTSKDRLANDNHQDFTDSESQRTASKASSSSNRDCCDSTPASRDGWHGKFYKGNGEPHRNLRLTAKLRDFHKYAKVDAESSKELEQWNEMLKNDAIKLCQENNFNTGFFEGSDNNSAVDAYELKVRLEHILERIALISDAASTERPSAVTSNLFIGGALAARSVYTLQYLGITHILCLCANEIGQSESQFPDIFEYKNFSVCDSEDFNITNIFEEACDFIDHVEQTGQKVLVHCFEGRSRSVSVVLAYLMLRKKYTLSEAWQALKRVHRRAHPNDGFAKLLQELDEKLHGKVSMEWQQRKPTMKVCPICGKNAGLSSSSLKLHLQKSHRKLSSGSVDSAMTMEIQKALTALKISRGGSVSPTQRSSHSIIDP